MQLFHIPKARFRHNYHHNGSIITKFLFMKWLWNTAVKAFMAYVNCVIRCAKKFALSWFFIPAS